MAKGRGSNGIAAPKRELSARDKIAEIGGEMQMLAAKQLNSIGDKIARVEGYSEVDGIEAVHLYLVNRHHWFPSQVRAMTHEDLLFCVVDLKFPAAPKKRSGGTISATYL